VDSSIESSVKGLTHQRNIRDRIIVTLGLLILAAIVQWVALEIPTVNWLSGVSTGLIVLAAAGIWVSFFAEREARIAQEESMTMLTHRIDARFSILKATEQAKIEEMYYDISNTRGENRYRDDLVRELQKAKGEIKILAVAAREFLHIGEGFVSNEIDSLINPNSKKHNNLITVKVALLHPCSEAAVSRGLREHPGKTFESYDESILWQDLRKSCITLLDWQEQNYKVEARLYKVSPACFLVFINDVLFAEYYHFGMGGRASGKIPLMKIKKESALYCELEGHFNYVWETAKPFTFNKKLFEKIEDQTTSKDSEFATTIQFTRPDLFQPGFYQASGDRSDNPR